VGWVGPPADDIGWNDVGSWNTVWELLPRDAAGNPGRAELLAVASRGNYVDAEGKLVALLGMENLIVVDTPDALLVGGRACAQQVAGLVKRLEQRKQEQLL